MLGHCSFSFHVFLHPLYHILTHTSPSSRHYPSLDHFFHKLDAMFGCCPIASFSFFSLSLISSTSWMPGWLVLLYLALTPSASAQCQARCRNKTEQQQQQNYVTLANLSNINRIDNGEKQRDSKKYFLLAQSACMGDCIIAMHWFVNNKHQ